jgi:hypothetical protein
MHIYLSPHHDDVCFSLAHLAERSGGILINLFTRSQYVASDLALPCDADARIDAVTRLRREEDLRFVAATRLARHDLEFPEPALIGRGPFDPADIESEIANLSARLVPLLLALLPDTGPAGASLYCPIGIGGHRNHLSTLLVVREAWRQLRARCTLFLYEDLPYASVPQAREAGLRHAAHVFAGHGLAGHATTLDPAGAARKMQHISLYASQLRAAPPEADFRPASGATSALHEIVWQVSRPDA